MCPPGIGEWGGEVTFSLRLRWNRGARKVEIVSPSFSPLEWDAHLSPALDIRALVLGLGNVPCGGMSLYP